MATWISAQQIRTLDSVTGSFGVGSKHAFYVHSLDHYPAVRLVAHADVSSFGLTVQWGQVSGTWLVGTSQLFSACSAAVGSESGQTLEFKTWGKLGRFEFTCGASEAQMSAYVYAVPIA